MELLINLHIEKLPEGVYLPRATISRAWSPRGALFTPTRIFAVFLMAGATLNGHAQVTSSVGLSYLPDYRDVELGAVVGSVGYRFQGDNGWSFQPDVRAGTGVIDDTTPLFSMSAAAAVPTDIDLEYLLGAEARVQYQPGEGIYFFAQPTLTQIEIDAGNVTGSSLLSDTEWEFGADIGAGFLFDARFGVEGSVGLIDGESVFDAGLRLYF